MHCVIQPLEALMGPHQRDTKTYSAKGYPSPTPPLSRFHPPWRSCREASLIKKEYCRCGPHPLQVISSRARPYLLREQAALVPFSQISGVGHSGSWPPLHCRDSTNLAPEVVPGASLHSEALSPECGREHQGTGEG